MNKTLVKVIIAMTFAVVMAAIAYMGFNYQKEAELKMDAMKYMENNWYGGMDEGCEIESVKDLGDGHYKVEFTRIIDGEMVTSDATIIL